MLSGFSTRTVRFLCLVQLIFAKGCSTTTIRNASIKEDISLGKLDDSARLKLRKRLFNQLPKNMLGCSCTPPPPG